MLKNGIFQSGSLFCEGEPLFLFLEYYERIFLQNPLFQGKNPVLGHD